MSLSATRSSQARKDCIGPPVPLIDVPYCYASSRAGIIESKACGIQGRLKLGQQNIFRAVEICTDEWVTAISAGGPAINWTANVAGSSLTFGPTFSDFSQKTNLLGPI